MMVLINSLAAGAGITSGGHQTTKVVRDWNDCDLV